jgi:hypothetical protein
MPRNLIGDPPFPPVILFNESRAFTTDDLLRIAGSRPRGATICIRYPEGPEKRGGYFFHFAPQGATGDFALYDFEKRPVAVFPADALVAFINHCTGKVFDEASFILCQTELNFLKDEEPGV